MAPLTIGSLFAGIGGFDLSGEAMGWRTSWFVEWDAACRGWLAEHFPGRPIYGDITAVDFTELAYVDVLCGGFPCPPVSAAGKRLGKLDPRWLWPHFTRAIRDVRPRYVAIENVPGLLSTRDDELGGQPLMGTVLGDLAALGYDAEWEVLSAGDVGAPQERERVWIVAYADGGRLEERAQLDGAAARDSTDRHPRGRHAHGRGGQVGHGVRLGGAAGVSGPLARDEGHAGVCDDAGHELGDATRERRGEAGQLRSDRPEDGPRRRGADVGDWSDAAPVRGTDGTLRLIPRDAAEAGAESPLWPVADGLPGRVARLRAIGNTVVPQCVIEGPFRVIAEREALLTTEAV